MTQTLFHGGPIVTMDAATEAPQAVLVRDGYIALVGSLADARAAAGTQVAVENLDGKCLLPGFIDAHSHPLWAAKTRGAPVVDVRAETVPTYRALLAKIRRRVEVAKSGEHLLFFGLDAQLHPDMESPTREELDALAPRNPIGIQTSNCHALYLNSAGLAACGIDEHFETPTGSIIDRDSSGRPTGRIAEAVTWAALESFYAAWGDERLNVEFEAAVNELIGHGITTVTEHLYQPYYKAYYLNALARGLPVPRIAAYQQATTADMRVERMQTGDDRLWMAGIKIHADGSPFIGNIWLSQPYLSSPMTLKRMNLRPGHTGGTNYPAEYFEAMVRAYFGAGWQMTIHTQGDRTIDMVLDLVERLLEESPRTDHRFRLEHCALMREDQVQRAVSLGVLCSFFINHVTHWGAPIEDALFGSERAAHYMPVGTAVRHGMRVSLHADTPMTDPSALQLMQAACTRIAGDGRCLGPSECISPLQALRAVTIDAAYQVGMESKLGSVTVGKHADFAVLDANPLQRAPDQLASVPVHQTWLAGERVAGV